MSTQNTGPEKAVHYQSYQDYIVARVEAHSLQPSGVESKGDDEGSNERKNRVDDNDCRRMRRRHFSNIREYNGKAELILQTFLKAEQR